MALTQQLIPAEEGDLPLTVARGSGSGAALVIVPSAFGVAADLQVQMEELARDATLVVSFDPFFRQDPGAAPYDDMGRVMSRLQALDRQRGYRDFRAVLDFARAEAPGKRLVVLGICFGAGYCLLAAADGLVDGVVTWHGSRMDGFLERAGSMRCPMRHHIGAIDPVVPAKTVDAVKQAFAGRANVSIIVHEGATHGFSHRDAKVHDPRAERAGMDSVRELVVG